MTDSNTLPHSLHGKVFPYTKGGPFPEWNYPEYNPHNKPLAVAVSGGSTRSYAAAVGQLRALKSLGILPQVGAISYSSGGSWFGTLFHYAPECYSDDTLLGPYIEPGNLTKDNINSLDKNSLLYKLTNLPLTMKALGLFAESIATKKPPLDKVFSYSLGKILLDHYGLNNNNKYFSLNQVTVADIIARNPGLCADNFYTTRPGRPYFITGGTLITPNNHDQPHEKRLWVQCDYTPLYMGVSQLWSGQGQDKVDIGGGYVEPFIFNSKTVQKYDANKQQVQVEAGGIPFSLSDQIGSAGASLGARMINSGHANVTPQFWYWPLTNIGSTTSKFYSIVDSGSLENCAIVNLLRRGYTEIIAFVNSQTPVDPPNEGHCGNLQSNAYGGVDGQISRLFGYHAPDDFANQPNNHIFPQHQFEDLTNAFRKSKADGRPIYYKDTYTTINNNYFDVPSYEVTVHWFYNDMNQSWKDEITDPEVLDVFTSEDPHNYMANFPALCFKEQNLNSFIQFTTRQVFLLANMQTYTVQQVLKDSGLVNK